MSRFATAFSAGQAAADSAQNARKEIAAVIDQLGTDVLEQSDGKIQMAVGESMSEVTPLTLTAITKLGYQEPNSILIFAKLHWLIARNPLAADDRWIRLAKIDFGTAGYPVSLIYDKVNTRCHDRDALEVALENFLESAWCGERVRPLLHRELKIELDYDNMDNSGES